MLSDISLLGYMAVKNRFDDAGRAAVLEQLLLIIRSYIVTGATSETLQSVFSFR